MEKTGKKISNLSFFALFLFACVCIPGIAHAAGSEPSFWDLFTGSGGISGFFAALLYPVVEILAKILALMGNLVNYAIQPGEIPLTSSDFVTAGWSAMRDLTNMLFILIMLGIALDYILFNSVGVKRALPRLLLVALLINFSLPIAGVILDFANVFTVFFIDQASGGTGTSQVKFTEALANQLHLSHLFSSSPDLTTIDQAMSSTFSNTILIILVLIGTIFVFTALAIMFFIRYFYISILLIVLPLVLVASILPQMGGHFKKWTNKFISWTMFAPAASFFLYLTMIFLGSQQMVGLNNASKSFLDVSATGVGAQITTFIFAWMLMLMSLTTAQSMGIAGASTAIATWSKGTKWARGRAGNYAKRGVEKVGGARVLEKGQQLAAKIPIAGGFGARALGGAAATIRSARREFAELTKGEKDIIETGNAEQVTSLIQGYAKGTADQKAKAAKMITLAEQKNKLKIRDAEGNVDFTATRAMKLELRAQAKAIGDVAAVKAIDRSDFSIAEQSINEKYDAYKNEGRSVDPDTGKSVEESRDRKLAELYRKIDIGREDWDDSVVDGSFMKNALKYGALNSERFKQAQKSGNLAIMEEFDKFMKNAENNKELAEILMNKENNMLRSWLKKTAAQDYVGNHTRLIANLEQKKQGSKIEDTEEQKLINEREEWRKQKGYSRESEEGEK